MLLYCNDLCLLLPIFSSRFRGKACAPDARQHAFYWKGEKRGCWDIRVSGPDQRKARYSAAPCLCGRQWSVLCHALKFKGPRVLNLKYVCHAQIIYFISSHINAWWNCAVPPTVDLKEKEKKVLAGPQTNVSLVCLVDGLPTPNITWTM